MAMNFPKGQRAIAFDRATAFPLDANAYFESLVSAEAAVKSAEEVGSKLTAYYFGQQIAVVENGIATLYIIEKATVETDVDARGYEGQLKEVGSKTLGIGQVMTLDFEKIKENMDEYVNVLNEMADNNYSVVVIFITDIIKNGSYVIYNSEASEVIEDAFGLKDVYEGVFLPKMVSRKKQILPNILSVMEDKK